MNAKELIDQYGRAELGIDGNCCFALIGENLQEGESEFVEIPTISRAALPQTRHEQFTGECEMAMKLGNKLWAARKALENLRTRLNAPNLTCYFGPSHPYGN
jgi:hypothetical protein